jgi:hypothetical protein
MGMDFLLPKILGLLIMTVWVYYSIREMYLYKYAETVNGKIIDVIDNPDNTSMLNKIITIEFIYKGEREVISQTVTGTKEDFTAEVVVYVNPRNISHSIIRPRSKFIIFFNLFIPVLFIILIIVSIFVAK